MVTEEDRCEIQAAGDLLAVIHRDGGHHREEHGLQAYPDAIRIVYELRNDIQLLTERISELEREGPGK